MTEHYLQAPPPRVPATQLTRPALPTPTPAAKPTEPAPAPAPVRVEKAERVEAPAVARGESPRPAKPAPSRPRGNLRQELKNRIAEYRSRVKELPETKQHMATEMLQAYESKLSSEKNLDEVASGLDNLRDSMFK
jgi:hypothetical protein